jgi:hypothetical protein
MLSIAIFSQPTPLATISSGTCALIASANRSNAIRSSPLVTIIQCYKKDRNLYIRALGEEIILFYPPPKQEIFTQVFHT